MDKKLLVYEFENPQTETQIVSLIKEYLLTGDQKQTLLELNLSVENLLNGEFPSSGPIKEKVRLIFTAWNCYLDKKIFTIWE